MDKLITIERTTEAGYESKKYELSEAVSILNTELKNERTIFIDGSPFSGEVIQEKDLEICKKEISVTNRLIGG